jgi:hypothetical protein
MNRRIVRARRAFSRLFWPRRIDGDESGMALVLVVGSMLVLMMFAAGGLTYAMSTLHLSRHDQDFNAALGAAHAGIDDYIQHLNENDSYWQTPDCSNPALVGPNGIGCDHSATLGWQAVNADGNPNGPEFHYDVNTDAMRTAGQVVVTSTGKVNGVTRTLQATVGRGGSTQFAYYTNFEDADPANRVVYPTAPSSQCSQYWWQGRSTYNSSGSKCVEIQFVTGDIINGPAHTNDTPYIGGNAEFVGNMTRTYSLESSDPACKTAKANVNDYYGCWRGSSSNRPIFDKPAGYADTLQLPDNSSQLATQPGCDYVGQTRIKFAGNKMQVWSPESNTTPDCGGNAPNGVWVATPDLKVIYAANNPDVAPHPCESGEIGDGLPLDGDITMQNQDQYCGQGNIYVEGTVQGRVTIGAENSIIITGDILLANGINGNDIVGLVAGNNVEVMHPWIATTTCQSYGWQKTPATTVAKSSLPSNIGSAQYIGWQEGYFTGSGSSLTWVPGKWVTSSNSSRPYWQGPSSSPPTASSNGSWVPQGSGGSWWNPASPQPGDVWRPGTWSQNWNGSFSWSAGSWRSPGSNNYYQGESWSYGCTNSKTTYGESSTWPHRQYNSGSSEQIQVYASIQTLQHSFLVQNYTEGSFQGKLTVYGSIAQNYRGIVGQNGGGGTGYLKNYNYDPRLVTQSPPYFPQWQNAQWATVRLGELQGGS